MLKEKIRTKNIQQDSSSLVQQSTKATLVKKTTIKKKSFVQNVDTINYKQVDSLSFFFYHLNTDKPQADKILTTALADAPEFYVDSVIAVDKQELTTYYDEYKYYMKYKNKSATNFYSDSTDWISGVLFIIILLILIIRNIKNKFISTLSSALFQYREFIKISETANYSDLNFNQFMKLIFALSSSLLVYLSIHFFSNQAIPKTLGFYLILVLAILILVTFKELIVRLSGFFLSQKELANKYNRNIQLFNSILGLTILPFIISIPFISKYIISYLLYSALVIITFLYTLRIIRFIKIFIDYNVSTLYLILYLCSLEILPNLLIYKIIQLFYFGMV